VCKDSLRYFLVLIFIKGTNVKMFHYRTMALISFPKIDKIKRKKTFFK